MHFRALSRNWRHLLDSGVSIELISAPGRGKSEFVLDQTMQQSKVDGFEWGFATCFLATMTPADLMGYMVPSDQDGRKIARFTLPPWYRTRDGRLLSEFKRGVLFLDEYGQGEADVKRASAELLLNGQLGEHKLPPGWSVVAASNRASDRSGVTRSFDFVINRRLQIEITDDLQSWEEWALRNGVHPTIVTFATRNSQVVFTDGVPKEQGPWCTPRSLVMLARILTSLSDDPDRLPTTPDAVEIASGMIGVAAASQLYATIKLEHELPRLNDILMSPGTAKLPGAPDARMLVCYQLAAWATEDNVDPIVAYMERLPQEFALTFGKAACTRDPDLVNTRAFGQWAMKNASLMSAILNPN